MSLTSLEKCILDTLAYFQIFNFPITSWEIYKNLWKNSFSVLLENPSQRNDFHLGQSLNLHDFFRLAGPHRSRPDSLNGDDREAAFQTVKADMWFGLMRNPPLSLYESFA